jgi:hypothetical protein
MPTQYSPSQPKTKRTKRLRRRKQPVKVIKVELTLEEKTDALYKMLSSESGTPVPAKCNDKKFYRLMSRLAKGKISNAMFTQLVNLDDDKLVAGPIGRVLETDSYMRTAFHLQWISLTDHCQESMNVIAMRLPNGMVGVVTRDGDIFEYKPGIWMYAEKVSTTALDFDLRKWNSRWVKAYFRLKLRHADTHGHINVAKPRYKTQELHQIRRINSSPSKKQRREISKNISVKPILDAGDGYMDDDVYLDEDHPSTFE